MIGLLVTSMAGLTACDSEDEATAEAPEEETQALEEAPEAEEEEEAHEEGAAAAEEYPDEPTIGMLAPDFTLVDETGESFTLSELRGQTVVLEWFNIPCPFVVRHYREGTFERLHQEFGGEDFQWLAIDTTWNNTPEDSIAWKAEANENREIDYPILQDPSGEVGRLYNAKTTPHMFVIDPDGILRYMGAIDDDPRGRKDVEERTNYVHAALTAMAAGEEVETAETEPYGCTVKYEGVD